MTLGEKLQRLRKARSWTQEELAEKVGVSRQSLSKWESDGALPDTANIIVLADLFGVTTDYLLRDAAPADASAPAESSVVPPVVQLVQPQKKAPPAPLVLGCILLTLGLLVWLGLYIAQCFDPWEVHIDDQVYTGIQAFIRGRHVEVPYYASIAAMVIGAVTIAYYFALQWVLRHEQIPDDTSSAS